MDSSLPGLARVALVAALVATYGGCIATGMRSGVIASGSGAVTMQTAEGRTLHLVLDSDARPLRDLGDCRVEVTGLHLGHCVFVKDWRVVDAGDGTVPFVGPLERQGSNLVLRDRNSGMPVVFDAQSEALLARFTGRVVLVSGFVVGPQVVHVMRYRVLGT
jgi:hypothetical protein